MDTSTLESFISYCDDMMIAEEGFKDVGKKIIIQFKNAFRKIITWFKNLLLNINKFKNAQMSAQMNKDIVKLLQMSQSRLELNFKKVVRSYLHNKKDPYKEQSGRKYGVYKQGMLGQNMSSTNVADEIVKCSEELDDAMKAAKSSSEYDRIQKNEYSDKVEAIPLSNITQDMKKSQMGATDMSNFLDKLDVGNDGTDPVRQQAIGFIRRALAYFQFRIGILGNYFSRAKASLGALKNNIKNKKNDDFKTRTKTKNRYQRKKDVIMSNEKARYAEDLFKECKQTTEYSVYKKKRDELFKLLKLNTDDVLYYLSQVTASGAPGVQITYAPNRKEKINISGRTLYHTSHTYHGLTQLKPTWKSGDALFPTPRVYVHVGVSLTRYSELNTKDDVARYVVTDNITTVYQDPELGRSACFIETEKPVNVKPITEVLKHYKGE